ncbi:MAG: S41 family peptidase [Prevotella sp.]|jgi:carboxyl-terminal processing protease|nr:S41 family peptidase [Prevotella sp.]
MDYYNRKNKSSIWLPLWIALGIAAGIVIGNLFAGYNSRKSFFDRNNKLEAILEYINESYVDSVNLQQLLETSIPDIVEGLDPHSVYISANDMEIVGDELEGHFGGIGVQFTLRQDTIVVVSIVPGGPSSAAGILAGDRIVYVNDSLYSRPGITNDMVLRTLRGKSGTGVKLGIKRYAGDSIVNIRVTRGDIPVSTVDVSYVVKEGIGYIKVSKFGSTTHSEFINALSGLKSKNCRSYIIDLRQNTGGYLGAAVQMVNEFFEKGQMIVYTEGRAFPRQENLASGTGICKNDQVIVLIDEGSASASEIFAGAIQDADRGLVLGRRSFGKGLVQGQRKFKDGSALRLTVARYHTPSGRCIQKAYETGKSDDYNQDLMRRYLRGEFDSQDSIKLENFPLFHTQSGRPVYGNDGIMPDIFVPRDTTGVNSYFTKLSGSGIIYEYAFNYTDQHREKLNSFGDWQQLSDYLKRQNLLWNLVSYADNQGVRQRPYLIMESSNLLQTQLLAYIIRNISGDEGYYQTLLADDVVIKKAIDLLDAKKALPNSVAASSYKD